jgi:hypothetical protein
MRKTFREIIPTQSDDEVMVYITDRRRYVPEAVEAAIAELARRGKPLPSASVDEIRADMKDIERKRKEDSDDIDKRISEARNPFVFVIVFLCRWYLRRGERNSSYDVALMVLAFVPFMNLLALSRMFGFELDMFGNTANPSMWDKMRFGLLYILPWYVVMRVLAPKEKVLSLVADQDAGTLGGLILGGYTILSIIFLVIVR